MNNLELFAFRVKKLRKARKLSQQGLAEVLGLTQTAISGIESGLRGTTIEKLILLAQFFEVSTDYLLGLKDEP
ncbi:MAG: helix-turn-helix transcriptional regulator [Oscillospiraceae bacterium]|jgi:transcriptional regulator with XRE-family HTH domain|nr:helix-turn-helix transcriptional regulator [Oscillospiraceae bacterium]MCI8720184.1 helix-turn-helix transcriptional regulator [Oscillospiraceae bacterium]MCI8941657.1 helix-turn-helix transcriptional regulator [Oscillospiraceae bacterium]